MNQQTLSISEQSRLVTIVIELSDKPLSFDDFREAVGLLCEDIPDLECLSKTSFSTLLLECWKIYQAAQLTTIDKP